MGAADETRSRPPADPIWVICAECSSPPEVWRGARNRRSGATVGLAMVTLRDRGGWFTGGVKHRRWGHGGPSLPGPQPDPGGAPWPPCPRPHRQRSLPLSRCSPARSGLALAGFLAGLHRPDPRGVRTGPAPVRQPVPAEPGAPVPGALRRYRVLRPRPGGARPRPGHQHPPSVHDRPGSTSTPSKKTCSSIHRPLMSAVRACFMSPMPPCWSVTSLARCWSPPGWAGPQSTH
jgi:hypothetical protein